ncbi:MAG: PLP-dependent aminotransferase family protein [Proteocatella sp.]
MLTYDMNQRGEYTLYEFLYRSIRTDILSGKIKKQDKLPSKRSLASHLNISVVTVENAYTQLAVEGYIYSVEKSGYYVSEVQNSMPGKKVHNKNLNFIEKNKSSFMDFKTNNVNESKFPFSIWSKVTREVLTDKNTQLLNPMPFNGIIELREEIAQYLYRFTGIDVIADQIIVGAGTEQLYNMLIQFFGKDSIFAVENPGYPKIAQIYTANEVKCEYIDIDEDGIDISKLERSNANIVHISPSHHFPTGVVMPIKRRQDILKWANEKDDRYIIEDEYDSEFRFVGRPISTLQSIDTGEKVIYMNTFSKTIAPTIRISYMILPIHLLESYRQKIGFYSCAVSSFEQHTLARFINRGYFERHINRMRNFYKLQRKLILDELKNSHFSSKIDIMESSSGLHFIVDVDTVLSDYEIINSAAENGIIISCLSEYYYGKRDDISGKIVINYSNFENEKLKEALERLFNNIIDN